MSAREAAVAALNDAADAIDADEDLALNVILGGSSFVTYWLRDRAAIIAALDTPAAEPSTTATLRAIADEGAEVAKAKARGAW